MGFSLKEYLTGNGARDAQTRRLSLRANALWNSVGSVFYQGCQWLLTVLVVKVSAGYADAGTLAYAMTIGNIFSPIAVYGMRVFQVSDVKNRYSQSAYFGFKYLTMALAAIVSAVYACAITSNLPLLVTVLLYLFFKADESLSISAYAVDQKAYRMDYIGVSQLLRGVASLLGFAGTLYLTHDINAAVIAMTLMCFAITLLYDLPHASRFGSVLPSISKTEAFGLLKSCLPIVLSNVFCGMVVSVVRQYFGNIAGTEPLGIYASVATPSVIVQLLASYLYNPAIAPLAEKWQSGNLVTFKRALLKVVGAMGAACLAMIAVLSLFGNALLVLFYGQEISNYSYLLPMVMVSTALIAYMWFATDLFVVMRQLVDPLIASAIALAASCASMVPMVSAFGMAGVNYAIVIGLALGIVFFCIRLFACLRQRASEID